MELLYALTLGVLTTCGVYLLLRARTFTVILGLTLLSHAVNLYLFASGRLVAGAPAIVGLTERSADPLPQALVLTAIILAAMLQAASLLWSCPGYIGKNRLRRSAVFLVTARAALSRLTKSVAGSRVSASRNTIASRFTVAGWKR